MSYTKTIGRLRVAVDGTGATMHDYQHGCSVTCEPGESYATTFNISVEEMRDLNYLLGRAISAADEAKKRRA